MKRRWVGWGSAALVLALLLGCSQKSAAPTKSLRLSSLHLSTGAFRGLTQNELEQIWEDAGKLSHSGEGSRLAYMLTKETPEGSEYRTFDIGGKRSPLIAQRSRDLIGKAVLSEAGSLSQLRWHSISMAPYSFDSRAGAGASEREFLNGLMAELETPPKELAHYSEDSIFFLVTFVGYDGFDQLPFLISPDSISKLPKHLRTLVKKAIEHSKNYEGLRRAEGARAAKQKGAKAKEVIKNLMVTTKDLPKE